MEYQRINKEKTSKTVQEQSYGGNLRFEDNRLEHITQRQSLRWFPEKEGCVCGVSVVQRDIENETIVSGCLDVGAVKAFFESFDKAANQAYMYVISVPGLGAFANLDGHTILWSEIWDDFLLGKVNPMISPAFGYVIESLISSSITGFRPSAPTGYSVVNQVTHGSTIPDFVLKDISGKEIAWLDLTASNSVGHIFTKIGWGKNVKTYAEITYPSLTSADLDMMKKNKDNTGTISAGDFQKRKEAAKVEYERRKEIWIKMGEAFRKKEYKDTVYCLFTDERKRDFIQEVLNDKFKTTIDKSMVPSVLAAMGVNAVPWEYTIGYVANVRLGEAWLIDHYSV